MENYYRNIEPYFGQLRVDCDSVTFDSVTTDNVNNVA